MTTIDQLKTELREFIKLSETITPAPWKNDGGDLWEVIDGKCGQFTGLEINASCRTKLANRNANFTARSRNISPTMAKMLLAAVERLEGIAASEISADPYEACNHPSEAQETLQQLLKLWEELL